MSTTFTEFAIKAVRAMMAFVVCAIVLGGALAVFASFHPLPEQYQPPAYSKVPAVFYVGEHAFKVSADYSFLPVSDYDGPGNAQIIFDFFYPDFTAEIDNPRLRGLTVGMPRYDNADLTLYVSSDDAGASFAHDELDAVLAGAKGYQVKPGPYGLLAVHITDPSLWTGGYVGKVDGVAIDIRCIQADENSCLAEYAYKDLSLSEHFSLPNLAHWQDITRKTILFLTSHEVR